MCALVTGVQTCALPISDHRAPGMNESDARADVDDRALLQRMAQGDRAALATLYHGYHGRWCRFLSRLTRRQDIIEEVVNDGFWIAWRQAGDCRGNARGRPAERREGREGVSPVRLRGAP